MTRLPGFGADSALGPYAIPDLDCPARSRPTLVTECLSWLPEFECVWYSSGAYDCWVKRWTCTSSQEVWQCRPPTLRALG